METLIIPNETDFKKWIKEAVNEIFQDHLSKDKMTDKNPEGLLNRKEIATFLRISLVTLNEWTNRGLPSHKQGGRVYFDKADVIEYIKKDKSGRLKFGTGFQNVREEIAEGATKN